MLADLVKYLHVLSALWLVAGLLGRDACYWHAARAADLPALRTLTTLAGVFESASVRPGTLVVFVTGLLTASLRGYPIFAFLRGEGPYWVPVAMAIFLSIVPVIAFVFEPAGRTYRTALAEAEARGTVSDALRRAIADPRVGMARGYELAMVALLVFLMVTRPF